MVEITFSSSFKKALKKKIKTRKTHGRFILESGNYFC